MPSLFHTPEDVQRQESAARTDLANTRNPLAGSLFNLGFGVSGAVGRATGLDTRSKAEKTAGNIQHLIQGLDLTNRDSITGVANKLQQAGFMPEAQQLISMLPAQAATFGPAQAESTFVTNPDGTVKEIRQNFQQKSDGQISSVGSAVTTDRANSAGSGAPPKLNTGLWSGFNLNDNMQKYFALNLFNQVNPDFYDADPDETQIAASQGKLEVFSARLKGDAWRATVRQGYDLFPGDEASANRWINAQRPIDDQVIAQEAINLIKESGGMEDFVKFNSFLDNEVKVATERDTTPAQAVERAAKIRRDKANALSSTSGRRRLSKPHTSGSSRQAARLPYMPIRTPFGWRAWEQIQKKLASSLTT